MQVLKKKYSILPISLARTYNRMEIILSKHSKVFRIQKIKIYKLPENHVVSI